MFFHLDERRSADRSVRRRRRSQPALPGDQPRAGQAYAGSGAAGEARGALLVADELAERGEAGVVVTLFPDNASKYLQEYARIGMMV